jgi:hypothetical protein|tara:strand:- start:2780 stop:3007 length:228 start_codon:yes stop_codon:yes gene_type:complete
MAKSPFFSKFKTDISLLSAAVEGSVFLDEEHPKLYDKVFKYYKSRNVYFYNDQERDYNLVLDNLEYDLMDNGVLV